MNIELLKPEDWPLIAAIYQEGIDTGHATFESHPPESWDEWIKSKLPAFCLGAWQREMLFGWSALSLISNRCVYAGVAEVSVYVAEFARGLKVGSKLLQALIEHSEAEGIWMLQAGIFPENEASVQIHAKHGFRLVGRREKLGKMGFGPLAGQWRDVLLLERRSTIAGIG